MTAWPDLDSSNIGIVIQARMGSTRLPGKVLMPIGGLPLLGHIFSRVAQLSRLVTVVVATTIKKEDDVVEEFCICSSVAVFRGSEYDVLDRYCACARQHGFAHVVRLTADNPFVDVLELDRLIDLHFEAGSDYTQSMDSLPIGVGAEIFTINALQTSCAEGMESHHREHVNEYILENSERFKISVLEVPGAKNRTDVRLTVDTTQDYQRACGIVENATGDPVLTEEAIQLCLHCA